MGTDVRKRCMKSVEGEAPPARRFPLHVSARLRRPSRRIKRNAKLRKNKKAERLHGSAAKKILHKRSAEAFFCSGFVQPLSFNCFTDFVFWV